MGTVSYTHLKMCALSNFKAAAYLVPQRCQLGVLEGRSFLFHLGDHIINCTSADVFLIDDIGLLAKGSLFKQCKERVMQGDVYKRQVETREITARYESDPLDVHNTLDYLLRVSLHGCLGCENSVEGDHIWCPDWELTITPQIEQITENSIVLNFYLFAPQWGKELFECFEMCIRDRTC